MKIFISGRISDMDNLNKEAFEKAEKLLREKGHQPINPHKIPDPNKEYTYAEYMKIDLRALLDCEGIYMLNDWEKSKGACIENIVATIIDLKIFYEGDFDDRNDN